MITNDVITKNNGKIRTSTKPDKLYIIQKIFKRAIQNVLFIEFEPLCQILAFLLCPITKYGHVTWPKLQISKIDDFALIPHSVLEKVTKFLVEKFSISEVISQNLTGGGGGGEHPPLPKG